MNVLVTGGTGFIGSHLVERLARDGHRVRCVAKDRLNVSALESTGAEIVFGDLTNGIGWDAMLDGVDCIFHLAGVTRARRTRDYYTGNHLATTQFINAVLPRCGANTRLVYVSSLTVTGPSRDGAPVTEETPCRPVSDYGKSKLLAEREVLRAADRMPVTIVRPAAVYGPRERDFFEYIHMARHGFAPVIGFGAKWINLVHVADLVDGILRAGTRPEAPGNVYLLGGPETNSTRDIGRAVAAAAGTRLVQIPVPHALAFAVGAVEEVIGAMRGRQMIFNMQKAREAVQRAWTCSIGKAQRELAYAPTITLFEGMKRTYGWYLREGWI